MSVNIPLETGKWLQSQRVLPRKATYVYPAPGYETTMLTVNKSVWIKFQNGDAIAALLKRYEAKVRGTASSQNDVMDTLREAVTPVAKLFNWNVVSPILDHHSVSLSEEDKAMIVAGDNKVLVKLLQTMMSKFNDVNDLASLPADNLEVKKWESNYANNDEDIEPASPEYSRTKHLRESGQHSNNEKNFSVALETGGKESKMSLLAPVLPIIPLNSVYEREATSIAMSKSGAKPKDGAKTIVEFIVISITKAFRTNVQSAALMLTVHAPKFAGLCIDGPRKGVARWLNHFSSQVLLDRLLVLLSKRPKDLAIFLGVLRPCIHSQNPSIALQAAKLITRLLEKIQTRIKDRKKSGMMPSSKSAPVIGIVDNSVRSKSKIKGSSKNVGVGYATRAKLVKNKGDKKAVARLLQEDAKSKARTPLENSLHEGWLWFVNNDGIGSSLYAIENHPTIALEITVMVMCLSENHFKELIQVHLRRNGIPTAALLSFFNQFLLLSRDSRERQNVIRQYGLIKNIATFALELSYSIDSLNSVLASPNSANESYELTSLQLLVNIWLLFPSEFLQETERGARVLALLRKQCRSADTSAVMTALGSLFDVCETSLGIPKPQHQDFAARTYKMLIFSLIESISVLGDSVSGTGKRSKNKMGKQKAFSNPVSMRRKRKEYNDDPNEEVNILRSFIALNMVRLVKAPGGNKLPVDVLLEPFLRQISIHGYKIEDLELLASLAYHPHLPLKQAVLMIDLLAKVSVDDLVYSKSASTTLVNVAGSFIEKTAVRRYLIRLCKVALGTYIKAEERALDESRSKNRREERGRRSKHEKENDGYSDEVAQQSRIFDLLAGLVTCDSMNFKQNLYDTIISAIKIITRIHKKEANRLQEMKSISSKSKRHSTKSRKDNKKSVQDTAITIGVEKLKRLKLILEDEIGKAKSTEPYLNGDETLDEVTDSKDVKDTFAIEDASFDDLKTALSQFDVDGAPRSENTTEKKPATNVTDDATHKSNVEIPQMTLPTIRELANGPREASLLRTPSPSYRTRMPKLADKEYVKAAKKRQIQGKIALKAKKEIDRIAEKADERRHRKSKEEESKKRKKENFYKNVRRKYVEGRKEWMMEKEVKELQQKEIEQALAKYNLKVDVNARKMLEKVRLQDADVLHAKAKSQQFGRAEKFLIAELMEDDAKARAMIMVNEGRCEVPRRENGEFSTLNQRFRRCMRLLFKIFTTRGGADAQRLLTFEEVRRSNLTIDLGEWLIMLNKLELYPPLEKVTLTAIFHKALNHLRLLGMEIDEQELDYTGFLTAIRILTQNFACAGLIAEDIEEKGEQNEMASRMKQWSTQRRTQSLSLPFDNWERFWEWFKDGAETKLSGFGVKKKHIDDSEMKKSLEVQKKFIEDNEKRRESMPQEMEDARQSALASGKIKEKPPDPIERLQGFGSTLKVHEDILKQKRKKIVIKVDKSNTDVYGNVIDEIRYGYGRNTLISLPPKSRRIAKEMLCFVEALVEISVSKSHNEFKSLTQLVEEASSTNAQEGLRSIVRVKKEIKEINIGIVRRNKMRKQQTLKRAVYIEEKAKELLQEEEEKERKKIQEKKEMEEKRKKNKLKLQRICAVKKKKEDEQAAEKQKLKAIEDRERQQRQEALKHVKARNEERTKKRLNRMEQKKIEAAKAKEIQDRNIEKLVKSSGIHTEEFKKKRDQYRKAIKREQQQESVRRGEARRRAVKEKKEAKERELAALNKPKRALPPAVRRRRKAGKVMYRAYAKQEVRDKEKVAYLRKVGGRGNVAAVHIQKLFRGYYTRENLDDKIQKVIAERKVRGRKKRNDAAIQIQRIARGRQGKKRFNKLQIEREEELAKAAEEKKKEEEEQEAKIRREKEVVETLRQRNEELTRRDRAKARRKRLPATKEDAEARATEYFRDEWMNYDLDVDGALNAMEFKRMVETISRQSLNLPECERFLAYIDKNGDNLLQLDEIVAFVSKGMAISDNQRKAWQNKSPLHKKLLIFIDRVAGVI